MSKIFGAYGYLVLLFELSQPRRQNVGSLNLAHILDAFQKAIHFEYMLDIVTRWE